MQESPSRSLLLFPAGYTLKNAHDLFENVKAIRMSFIVTGDGVDPISGDLSPVSGTFSTNVRRFVEPYNMFDRQLRSYTGNCVFNTDFSDTRIFRLTNVGMAVWPRTTFTGVSGGVRLSLLPGPLNGTFKIDGVTMSSNIDINIDSDFYEVVFDIDLSAVTMKVVERYDLIEVNKRRVSVGEEIEIKIPGVNGGDAREGFKHVKRLKFGNVETTNFTLFQAVDMPEDGIRVKIPAGATSGPIEFFAEYDANNMDWYYTRFNMRIV
jgi:hypothetical protein